MGINTWAIDNIRKAAEAKKSTINPYQQMMAQRYLEENPEADFSGIPGYQAIQERFQKKLINQGGPLYKANKDKEGKITSYSPKKGAKEKMEQRKVGDPTVMGRTGFEPMSAQKRKDQVFGKIQEKRQSGEPISDAEARYEKKYLGISDSKTVADTPEARLRIRKTARDMAQAAFIDEGVDQKPGEEDIQAQMPEATKFLYPKADVEAIEKKDYSITLPENIGTIPQARKYLMELGLDEEDANNWLMKNVEAK